MRDLKTQEMLFEGANAMLASTWHHLKMNETSIEVPAGLAIEPHVEVSGACVVADDEAAGGSVVNEGSAAGAFESALAAAQAEWELMHPAPTPEELAEREEFLAAEADATYGGTARSAYQIGADALEEARSLALAFEHGISEEAAAYLRFVAGRRVVIEAAPGEQVEAQLIVTGVEGGFSAVAIDIIAAQGSSVNVSLLVRNDAAAPTSTAGFTGSTVHVFAAADAQVNITRTQALGPGFTDLDDMALFAADRASINITQTVLGASSTFTGLATDLRGEASRIDIATHYLGRETQAHDFNYLVRHHGARSECDLQANGVLAGKARKTLRGTIDLIRGAKGAQGSENETVLLVDEGVRNKTVPVILCNEDDVAGNHGATIGHIRDEQMFYLASRGLSREAAERMFVTALVEQTAIDAPNSAARESVVVLGDSISPGFAALFDEEA